MFITVKFKTKPMKTDFDLLLCSKPDSKVKMVNALHSHKTKRKLRH